MKLITLILFLFISACSSNPKSFVTKPGSILINSPENFDACKFLGVVETKDIENWQQDLKTSAANLGATHIQSKGPNYVGFNEIVSGYAYLCK